MLALPALISSIHWTSMSSTFFNSVSFPFAGYYGVEAIIALVRHVLLWLVPVPVAPLAPVLLPV